MDKIVINTNENFKSEIIIKDNLKNEIKTYFEDKKYFLITNTTLAKLYPDFIYKFDKNRVIIIKDGEKYKNIKTYSYVINELLKEKIERKDAIIAFGGGVVGDLAGYVASTILRGIELIQVPTTLLAMCDSSIGGKTGINSSFGKNLIGTFYFASKVLIDPIFLNTLNNYEYKCGLGEILKYALIEKSCKCNETFNLLDFLEENSFDDIKMQMEFIIKTCATLKANVVQQDKSEKGLRKILNFGHTYAHSIETLSNYKKFSHGEAVAHGIKYASKLGVIKNLITNDYCKKIINLLEKFNLTDKKVKYSKNKIIELMFQDKKTLNGNLNLLLPSAPSEVVLFENIDLPSIEASLL